jgi:stage IV sporulation protein B
MEKDIKTQLIINKNKRNKGIFIFSLILTTILILSTTVFVFAKDNFAEKLNNTSLFNSDTPLSNQENERLYVIPGGELLSFEYVVDGAIITSFNETKTFFGISYSVAKNAGLQIGDIIIQADNTEIHSSNEFIDFIVANNSSEITLRVLRENEKFLVVLRDFEPLNSIDSLGVEIGNTKGFVGTATFYVPENNAIATLAHSYSFHRRAKGAKPTTRNATFTFMDKGEPGRYGAVYGIGEGDTIASMNKNTNVGIFGYTHSTKDGEPIPIAKESEITKGYAQIICTAGKDGPKYYDIEITELPQEVGDDRYNFVFVVTDTELIDAAGGTVRGMSGSPIIQNGMLIGAAAYGNLEDPRIGKAVSAGRMANEL